MADSAFQIQYRQEFIAQFEQGQSWLRNVCTTEAVIKGNQAMFLVAGSGGATAVTRGLNGNIPPRVDSLTQVPATLVEWHDKPQRTEFNIFASQGDGRRIMQSSTVKVLNRKIDQDILGVLSGASSNLGAPQAMTLALATRALAHLDLQDVDTTEEDNMFILFCRVPDLDHAICASLYAHSPTIERIAPMARRRCCPRLAEHGEHPSDYSSST